MYRYSQRVKEGMGPNKIQRRVTNILLVLLIIAVVVLAILGGKAMRFQHEESELFIKRMQSEATQAISQTNSLSRTGGSSTSSVLAKIRQHVYAMQTLCEMHAGLRGSGDRLVSDSVFTNLYAVIDSFESKLQSGQQTTQPQTELVDQLSSLNQIILNSN